LISLCSKKSPGFAVASWAFCSLPPTINYIDRNVFGFVLINDGFSKAMLGLRAEASLTETHICLFQEQMEHVDAAFKLAYGLPTNNEFWITPAADWTSKKTWKGQPMRVDKSMVRRKAGLYRLFIRNGPLHIF
jgi:hypothetical protein